jgi:preprotein translocase subunit Sec63
MDRDNEVNRILGAFKLNPFEQLGIRFDATLDDAKRQYRKASLLVRAASPHRKAGNESAALDLPG